MPPMPPAPQQAAPVPSKFGGLAWTALILGVIALFGTKRVLAATRSGRDGDGREDRRPVEPGRYGAIMTIETSTVRVGDLSAYLARPDGGSERGTLLLPMITGIGTQVRAWADELAGRGITALAWDVFHGASTDNTSREDLGAKLGELRDEPALAEQTALLDHLLGDLGCTSAGVMGWCLGGRFALLLAARDQRLSGVVAYHPTVRDPAPPNHELDTVDLSTRITAPVLVAYPEADSVVSHETFGLLQAALQSRARGATFTQHFPGAEHGFSDSARHGASVNAEAFALSWPQTLAFVDTLTFGSGPAR